MYETDVWLWFSEYPTLPNKQIYTTSVFSPCYYPVLKPLHNHNPVGSIKVNNDGNMVSVVLVDVIPEPFPRWAELIERLT